MTLDVRNKDYLITRDGLCFAVVTDHCEPPSAAFPDPRYLCLLRYVRDETGYRKLGFDEAHEYLRQHGPKYLCQSKLLDVLIHAVSAGDIDRHLTPIACRRALAARCSPIESLPSGSPLESIAGKALEFSQWLTEQGVPTSHQGITGSLMLGVEQKDSDIDIVILGIEQFQQVRSVARELLGGPEHQLTDAMWRDTWNRRECELTFDEYLFHERCKFNKLNWRGTRIDLTCRPFRPAHDGVVYPVRKQGRAVVTARVVDDTYAFANPAVYPIEHETIREIQATTATYVGQAKRGQWVRASGMLEQDQAGICRLIVGTSRAARGEYIRVENPERAALELEKTKR